jgi:hypothetical protein
LQPPEESGKVIRIPECVLVRPSNHAKAPIRVVVPVAGR